MRFIPTRRDFMAGLAAASAGSLFAGRSHAAEAPEITKVRLPRWIGGAYCWAASYIAEELLRAEGIRVYYFQGDPILDQSEWMNGGETDFSINYPPMHLKSLEAGVPIKVIGGLHSGCLELIANETIRKVKDLKGKRVGVWLGGVEQTHVALMTAYVGLDPERDIIWVHRETSASRLLAEGKIDAFLAGPPWVQEARQQKIGHSILNTATDPPWSQQFCCMISASAEYVSRYPVATKRVLRAMLKSADLCASDPAAAAGQMVAGGFVKSYDYALQTLKDIRYDRWREYDPDATMLFFALRMREVGYLNANPQEIIASGTDWRFFNELKRELKT